MWKILEYIKLIIIQIIKFHFVLKNFVDCFNWIDIPLCQTDFNIDVLFEFAITHIKYANIQNAWALWVRSSEFALQLCSVPKNVYYSDVYMSATWNICVMVCVFWVICCVNVGWNCVALNCRILKRTSTSLNRKNHRLDVLCVVGFRIHLRALHFLATTHYTNCASVQTKILIEVAF